MVVIITTPLEKVFVQVSFLGPSYGLGARAMRMCFEGSLKPYGR